MELTGQKKKKKKQIENYEKRNEIAGSLCLGGWHDTVESPTLYFQAWKLLNFIAIKKKKKKKVCSGEKCDDVLVFFEDTVNNNWKTMSK